MASGKQRTDHPRDAVGGQTVDPGLPVAGPTTVVADKPRPVSAAGLAVGAGFAAAIDAQVADPWRTPTNA